MSISSMKHTHTGDVRWSLTCES